MSARVRWIFLLIFSALLSIADPLPVRKGFQLATWPFGVGARDARALKADIIYLKSKGADLFRFPIYIHHYPLESWLQIIETLLPFCQENNCVLVLTLHGGPVAGFPLVETVPEFGMWWEQIADRLSKYNCVWYDLANEPDRSPTWEATALQTANIIRNVDKRNYIVYCPGGSTTRTRLHGRPLPGISRQIVTFHFYDWSVMQFSEFGGYPSQRYSKAVLGDMLRDVAKYGQENRNIPVYIGEVAINAKSPSAARFLHDFTDFTDHFGISTTIHAYKEAPIWDVRSNPSAWRSVLDWFASDPW